VLATVLEGISEIRLGDTPVTATAVRDVDGRELARGAFEFRPLTGGTTVLRETSGAICGAQEEVGGGAVVVVSLAAALRDSADESELGEWLFSQLDRWRVKSRGELARISTDPARPF
jgi:hypothetical protein